MYKRQDKYYPDILKEVDLLENLVEQIKEEPRILYDENYVKGWKDELTIERESLVKIVINLLQSVLNELDSAHTLLSSKKNFDRWSEAKNWLKAIFEAASSGSLSKLVYYGPDADKSPTDKRLLAEFNSLKNKIQKFLNKYYPFFLDTNKKSTKGVIMLSDHINTLLIDEALCNFAQIYQKSLAPYSGVIASKLFHEVNSIDKIVMHLSLIHI